MTTTPEERLWAMLSHLLALVGLIVPMTNFIPPAAIYFVHRDHSKFVSFHALQSLLFQVAMFVLGLIWGVLTVVIGVLTCGLGLIAFAPIGAIVVVAWVVFIILVSVRSYNGELYEYPFVGKWAKDILGI